MNHLHELESGKRVTFYEVGLACEAAPDIGCGIRSKPILQALESNSLVSGAWLSRSGGTLAVEWAEDVIEDQEGAVIRAAFGAESADAAKIIDPARLRAIEEEFADRGSWYRKSEIDELSQEESWVIANRLVRRMLAITKLESHREEAVKRVIAKASAEVLATAAPGTLETREKLLSEAILQAGCCELYESEVDALRQAIARGGHRPVVGEA